MSQNEGILGTVKQYIPGMSNEEHHKSSSNESYESHDVKHADGQQAPQSGGGILSYIPGFGGGTGQQTNEASGVHSGADAPRTTRSGTIYGNTDDNGDASRLGGGTGAHNTGTGSDGIGSGYGSGNPSGYDRDDNESGKGLGGAATTTTGDINETKTHLGDGPGRNASGSSDGLPTGHHHGHHHGHHNGHGDSSGIPESGRAAAYGTQDGGYGAGSGTGGYGAGSGTGGHAAGSGTTGHAAGSGYGGGQHSGTDRAYGTGSQPGTGGYGGRAANDAGGNTTLSNPGFGGAAESDVKGAPIEGENVKGYAVSAPVGTGDVNVRPGAGDPSGQVSGAHMQYGPVDVDDRDTIGRGTVGRTSGEGDSSFANVKRDIPHGTEHVTSHQSTSRVSHTSTTQL